jgi:hypothetical protein
MAAVDSKPVKMKDGVPVDPKDWTPEDWRDLREAIDAVKEKIAKRHEKRNLRGSRDQC